MSENNSISDESYSDDDDEEELDPRIQDELEKLNAATNSINHLEAELDEARAVFRQTLAGATYQLNGVAQKLGKCVEKSRPFYEAYRQLRQSHSMLQKSTNQFERATGMHVAAKNRVSEAERRVFGGGAKRAFDSALQEMLNQATIEVNEAEKMKRDSWKKHQEDLLAYRDLEAKVKQLYKKLKSHVEKAKPYFEQKKDFDRHLWQLKLRVDSIHIGLAGAKENYSSCLKSLEVISDEIHEKRKSKRMEAMIAKLQEREAGVGADSSTEDETSLTASNLDLDFDSNVNFDKLDGIGSSMSLEAESFGRSNRAVAGSEDSFTSVPLESRVVYGLESPKDAAGLGCPGKEAEPGKSNLQVPDKESSLEAVKFNDEPSSSLENAAPSTHETSSGNAPSIQSDLPRGESIATLENSTTHEENCAKDAETTSDDFSVTVAVDEMLTPDTMKSEDNKANNKALTTQVETEDKQNTSIAVEESEGLESEDKKEIHSESHETQNEKIASSEGQNDSYNSDEAAKGPEDVKDFTELPTGKNETRSELELNEKPEQEKKGTNGDNDFNTENVTEEKQTNEKQTTEMVEEDKDDKDVNSENVTEEKQRSDSGLKEKVEDEEVIDVDGPGANVENTTKLNENNSEIKENDVEQDKNVTDEDTGVNAENTAKLHQEDNATNDQA